MRSVAPFVLVVAMLAAGMLLVDAYPSGPPLSACRDMRPTGHGTSTLTGTTPFSITANTTFYNPGENIEVTISGAQFIGFFVQARRRDAGSDMNTAEGTITPGNTNIGKTLDCTGGTDNAWSHKTNAPKTSESAIWTAPSEDKGTIAFRATIVQGPSSDRYWTDVYSANLPFGAPASPTSSGGGTTTDNGNGSNAVCGSSVLLVLSSCVLAAIQLVGS
ncbi:putative defense protein 1 [Lytechinus variegatus]|uniref:putative defense protein 1 n=1 Tax=Lytechinus variegatus TaxID=7654 RepID=UPI001BB1543F|nr:putative defense protein 1 [Lytechinus variegatus]